MLKVLPEPSVPDGLQYHRTGDHDNEARVCGEDAVQVHGGQAPEQAGQ